MIWISVPIHFTPTCRASGKLTNRLASQELKGFLGHGTFSFFFFFFQMQQFQYLAEDYLTYFQYAVIKRKEIETVEKSNSTCMTVSGKLGLGICSNLITLSSLAGMLCIHCIFSQLECLLLTNLPAASLFILHSATPQLLYQKFWFENLNPLIKTFPWLSKSTRGNISLEHVHITFCDIASAWNSYVYTLLVFKS